MAQCRTMNHMFSSLQAQASHCGSWSCPKHIVLIACHLAIEPCHMHCPALSILLKENRWTTHPGALLIVLDTGNEPLPASVPRGATRLSPKLEANRDPRRNPPTTESFVDHANRYRLAAVMPFWHPAPPGSKPLANTGFDDKAMQAIPRSCGTQENPQECRH